MGEYATATANPPRTLDASVGNSGNKHFSDDQSSVFTSTGYNPEEPLDYISKIFQLKPAGVGTERFVDPQANYITWIFTSNRDTVKKPLEYVIETALRVFGEYTSKGRFPEIARYLRIELNGNLKGLKKRVVQFDGRHRITLYSTREVIELLKHIQN